MGALRSLWTERINLLFIRGKLSLTFSIQNMRLCESKLYVVKMLYLFAIKQKLTHYCKAIILQ